MRPLILIAASGWLLAAGCTLKDYVFVPVCGDTFCDAGSSDAADGAEAMDAEAGDSAPGIPTPRLVAPLSGAKVSSNLPRLRWELPAGQTAAHVQLCSDRACARVLQEFDVMGSDSQPTTPLPVGPVFWRVDMPGFDAGPRPSSPTWEFVVGHGNARVDTAYGAIFDPNGDGYADLLVTETNAEPGDGGSMGGRFHVYSGVATGFGTSALHSAIIPAGIRSDYGLSVGVGDLNGDGFVDAVVGASGVTGQVSLYTGSPSGLNTVASRALALPDGADSWFGVSTCANEDFNRDGYADLVVGDTTAMSGSGIAYVYWGGPRGVSTTSGRTLSAPDPGGGYGICAGGDLNGDGFGDLVVAGFDVAGGVGRVYYYLGSTLGLLGTPSGAVPGLGESGLRFGGSLATGDLNGDGYSDVVMSSIGFDNGTGRVGVYLGGPSGLSGAPEVVIPGPDGMGGTFGISLGSGDVDGDGIDDLMAGAPGVASQAGRMYLFRGATAGPSSSPTATLDGPDGSHGIFGTVSAAFGDINLDGYDDVLVGAPFVGTGTGRVYVYLGAPGGLHTTPDTVLSGSDGPMSFFGTALTTGL